MTPISSFPLKLKSADTKRKRLLTFKPAIRLTNSLIRKFRELKIIDSEEHSLPPKKRKLTDDRNHVDSGSIFDCFMLDFSLSIGDENEDLDTRSICLDKPKPTNLNKTICYRRFNILKKSPRIRIHSSLKIPIPKELRQDVNLQQLIALFQNSVNFIQPKGHAVVEDVDLVVRSFSSFGKVLSIQDHWIQPQGSLNRYPSVWIGATVTYRHQDSCECAIRATSISGTTLLCESVAAKLVQIHRLEAKWTKSHSQEDRRTSILVKGVGARDSRHRFMKEFCRYGTVLQTRWTLGAQLQNVAEVTYKSTVSAVAAALALDGKSLFRCLLRAQIRITEKELYIHRKLRETY